MTVSTHLPTQAKLPLPAWQTLPTMYDLPSGNQDEQSDDFHFLQTLLLYLSFVPTTCSGKLAYSACSLNLYYDLNHPQLYKRPDWFGVVGVPRLYHDRDLRLSYPIWQENVSPCVVVELLSPGTEDEDLGRTAIGGSGKPPTKWVVYEQILQVPYYFVFNRYNSDLQAFYLVGGHYKEMAMTDGRWWIPELGLSLGLWQGKHQHVNRLWLRWMTEEGKLIPVPREAVSIAKTKALRAQKEADEAKKEAAAAKRKAEKLAERLRELGVDPAEID